ncbi:hypothetical protein WJX75_003070 [Coccomyxa subellipsoidea]|uniref:Large ribosomal subunit protein bL21m n=1 Tax=Coccomyxa subellipsoidea TaxID=248742 RepID=A0ABR2YPS2_9CHLO
MNYSSGNPQGSEASRKPRFPFDGKRKPPSSRPHSGGLAPEVAAKQDWPQQVARIGKVLGPYEVPRKPVFAVVELGPTQFKVSPGDIVVSEKIRDVDVNDKVKLARVMMLGSRHETIIGRPLIPQASITAVVEEQFQDAKVLIFKKRRRKNSRRLKGHRQDLTTLRIVEIHGIDEHSHSQDQSTSHHVAKELREEAA